MNCQHQFLLYPLINWVLGVCEQSKRMWPHEYPASNKKTWRKLRTERQKTLPSEHELSKTWCVCSVLWRSKTCFMFKPWQWRWRGPNTVLMPSFPVTALWGATQHLLWCIVSWLGIRKLHATARRSHILPHEWQNVCGDETANLPSIISSDWSSQVIASLR